MQLKDTQDALNAFGKYVVQQSRSKLTQSNKNVSKRLYESLGYELKVMPSSFSMAFLMENYGEYQDKGVSGTEVKYNTPYKYTNKMPPPSAFSQWVVRKGLKGTRDASGRFVSRKGLQFAIAKSIFKKGIKPSLFFTKPFEAAFKNLPNDIVEAYGLDVENFLKTTINNKATR
jgi:hypothetical protein